MQRKNCSYIMCLLIFTKAYFSRLQFCPASQICRPLYIHSHSNHFLSNLNLLCVSGHTSAMLKPVPLSFLSPLVNSSLSHLSSPIQLYCHTISMLIFHDLYSRASFPPYLFLPNFVLTYKLWMSLYIIDFYNFILYLIFIVINYTFAV